METRGYGVIFIRVWWHTQGPWTCDVICVPLELSQDLFSGVWRMRESLQDVAAWEEAWPTKQPGSDDGDGGGGLLLEFLSLT